MPCKKHPRDRRIVLILLRRLHRLLLVQEAYKGKLNEAGDYLLKKSINATLLDLSDLGHKKAAYWYIRHKPLKLLFSAKHGKVGRLSSISPYTPYVSQEGISLDEGGKLADAGPRYVLEKLDSAIKIYLDAKKGRVYREDGVQISLGGRDLQLYRKKARKRVWDLAKQLVFWGFREQVEQMLKSYRLSWDDIFL